MKIMIRAFTFHYMLRVFLSSSSLSWDTVYNWIYRLPDIFFSDRGQRLLLSGPLWIWKSVCVSEWMYVREKFIEVYDPWVMRVLLLVFAFGYSVLPHFLLTSSGIQGMWLVWWFFLLFILFYFILFYFTLSPCFPFCNDNLP